MNVATVRTDLIAEQEQLDQLVADLPAEAWQLPTPSPGWAIADQIGHLTYFDRTAAMSIARPDDFIEHRNALFQIITDTAAVEHETIGWFRALDATEQLATWRAARDKLAAAGEHLDDDARVEWYGPSMGGRSFLTARLMEVWAHGQDVADTLAEHGYPAQRAETDRLRHIAQLGVITRGWSYKNRGLDVPDSEVRVELTSPSGDIWEWGPADAEQRVAGPALDFCLVATQRRHVDDTELTTVGDDARDWMIKAQAFAGAPTDGPAARH